MNCIIIYSTSAFSLDHMSRAHGRLHSYLPEFKIRFMLLATDAPFDNSRVTRDLGLAREPFRRCTLLKSTFRRVAAGEETPWGCEKGS